VDLVRRGATRLTNGPELHRTPIWSPDGTRLACVRERNGVGEIHVQPATGGQDETLLSNGGLFQSLDAWMPDGRSILFSQLDPVTQRDIWVLPLEGDRTPRPYLKTLCRSSSRARRPTESGFRTWHAKASRPTCTCSRFRQTGRSTR